MLHYDNVVDVGQGDALGLNCGGFGGFRCSFGGLLVVDVI